MAVIPMFPLGSVLFPHMPLALRIFEERYLALLAEVLAMDEPAFGVVLIERGQEVGGGEHRFPTGTMAEVAELGGAEGFVALTAVGGRRFEVVEWLDDDPYPRAEVDFLDELVWREGDERLATLRTDATAATRQALAVASEFTEQRYASVIELADDPVEFSWQLAGVAPVGELDQLALLRSASLESLLETVAARSAEVTASFRDGVS